MNDTPITLKALQDAARQLEVHRDDHRNRMVAEFIANGMDTAKAGRLADGLAAVAHGEADLWRGPPLAPNEFAIVWRVKP